MEQKSIVLDLLLNWLSTHAIHDDLVATLDHKAVAYNTVTCYLRDAKLGTAEVGLDREPCSARLDDSDLAIWQPWTKVVFVCDKTCPNHPYSTRYRLWKTHKIALVCTMSASLGAAPSVKPLEGETC
jgi:hypothetical protein